MSIHKNTYNKYEYLVNSLVSELKNNYNKFINKIKDNV